MIWTTGPQPMTGMVAVIRPKSSVKQHLEEVEIWKVLSKNRICGRKEHSTAHIPDNYKIIPDMYTAITGASMGGPLCGTLPHPDKYYRTKYRSLYIKRHENT